VAAGEALTIADATGNEALWCNAAALKGWFLADRNEFAAGIALMEEAWHTADRIGHVVGAYFAALQLATVHYYAWDFRAALAAGERELATHRPDLFPDWRNLLLAYGHDSRANLGDHAQARPFVAEHPDTNQNASQLSSRLMFIDGEWERAVAQIAEQAPSWRERGVDLPAHTYFGCVAHFREVLGGLDEAVQAVDMAMDIGDPQSSFVAAFPGVIRAKLMLQSDDFDLAGAAAAEIRQRCRVPEWHALGGRLDEIDAEIHLSRGEFDAAEECYRRAKASAERYPYVLYDAEFELRWGLRISQFAGDADRARQHVDNAIEIYRRHGYAQRWIDRAEALATR
jgi:tetratricopeptide (TPR) repeat protein